MYGQYIGPVEGSSSGVVIVDIDSDGAFLRGSASFFPHDPSLPATVAHLPRLPASTTLEFSCPVFPLDRQGNEINEAELQRLFPGVEHSAQASVSISFLDDKMFLQFLTDKQFDATGVLKRQNADASSNLTSLPGVHTWKEFVGLVEELDLDGFIFRGQSEPHRLRTSFHRTHRKDLVRYLEPNRKLR